VPFYRLFPKKSLKNSRGPGLMQEIALVILVPRSLTGTFFETHPVIVACYAEPPQSVAISAAIPLQAQYYSKGG
jgi:hypothetical protein